MIRITSREFRDKQASIFDLADKGEHIIINRGKKQAYTLVPIKNDDIQIAPSMEIKILQAIQSFKEGKTTKVHTKEELHALLGSL